MTTGSVMVKILSGRTAAPLQRYRDSLTEGQEAPLFTATRHCSHDAEIQIAEWKAVREEHDTQGAKRKVGNRYEAVDPETGIHANGQRGTHVRFYDGRRWRKRPVRSGETPTHLCIKADALVADVKQSEAVHTIYAAGADLVNPDNIDDCARFFLAVNKMRDATYPGIQESIWLERNGESGLVHVHVASNATIYHDFELDGVQYAAGNKLAGDLTNVHAVRAVFERFLDAYPEYGFEQRLARVGTTTYADAQRRDGQRAYWEAKRGQVTQQDRIRCTVSDALLDNSVTDRDSFITKMDEHGVEVGETGLRRGAPGKNCDYLYRLKSAKQKVKGRTLGVEYSYDAIGTQLDLKALSGEVERPVRKQKAGPRKLLPFEATPWDEATQRAWEKVNADVAGLIDDELKKQATELLDQGPARIGRSVVAELENRRSAWSTTDLERALDRHLRPLRETAHDDLDQVRGQALETARSKLISVLDEETDSEYVRHWTTQEIIDQERVIEASLAVRSKRAGVDGAVTVDRSDITLSKGQTAATRVLTGSHRLVVIEGPAGSGKTATLAAANEELISQSRRMIVVSPTKKGAIEAGKAIHAEGNSVHAMLYRAGAYMDPDDNNRWVLPEKWMEQTAAFRTNQDTVLVIDEAGMLDTSTAAALHRYVDDMNLGTLAVMGDSQQLAAVGRGGYLRRAAELAEDHLILDEVRRFRTSSGQLDAEYADATLKLRLRHSPEEFVNLLTQRDQLSTGTDREVIDAVADRIVEELDAGHDSMAISATNVMNQRINHAIFDRLAATGVIDDSRVVAGRDGDRIAVGAKVATRKNNTDMDVANRECWTVEQVRDNGGITVADDEGRRRDLTEAYVREDVQLAWALTGHGAQGMTVDRAHVVLTDRTDAAGLYVGLTRGRYANTVYAVADDDKELRRQFAAATRRENADAGLAHARQTAEREATDYATAELTRLRDYYPAEVADIERALVWNHTGGRTQTPSSEAAIDARVTTQLESAARTGELRSIVHEQQAADDLNSAHLAHRPKRPRTAAEQRVLDHQATQAKANKRTKEVQHHDHTHSM